MGKDKYCNPQGTDAWEKLKQMFAAMRDGSPFGVERIDHFNGSLFAEDTEMDALKLPNCVFCEITPRNG